VAAKEGGLNGLAKLSLKVGAPIKVMLYPKAEDFKEAFEIVGKPAQLEFKYDGFRIQAHKKDNKITLFTRRLENVTKQFPDVVEFVKEHVKAKEFIIDSEAVGYDPKTKKYIAFQSISQRIKRKYDIEKTAKEFPVELNIFDIVECNGTDYLNKPFRERRKLLEKVIPKNIPLKIRLAEAIVTDDVKKAEKFYQQSLAAGNEGVMAKSLDAAYQPGRRVGGGVKVKPVMETLDLVIVGAEKGEGKRAGWLSSFIIACRDEDTDDLVEIGRVSTGFKEKKEEGTSFEEMTELLEPLIIDKKSKIVVVKPKIIIEVAFEEIQKSPEYSSGYALRFPRLVRLREDRGVDDSSTLREVDMFYNKQRGRHK
ncbi:MAG: ATP-dependent DNA ligase, partial [Nanoarchaeota archaeon]